MSTHNLCFEQKYEKYQFLPENFQFYVKFSIYLSRRIFVKATGFLTLLPFKVIKTIINLSAADFPREC